MYRDFERKAPMEVETFLGSPVRLAHQNNVAVPRIETLYAMLHHINIVNRTRLPVAAPAASPNGAPPPRLSSAPLPRPPPGPGGPMMNGNGPMKGGPRPGSRAPSINGAPPMMRRGPPPGMNGYPPRAMNGNGYPPQGPNGQRRPSFDESNLEEFSHLMLYDNIADDGGANGAMAGYENGGGSSNDLTLRERELMLRQKELQLREQELNMRRGPRGPPPRAPPSHMGGFDEDDDEDDFFDPMAARGPGPMIDPDNFDMMSVTSRRTRKIPSASQIRKNPEGMGFGSGGQGGPGGPGRSRNPFQRPGLNKNRTSARMMQDVPGLHDSIMNNPLLGYSSNRYGNVDRGEMGAQSRTNSLTAARLDELQQGGGYTGGAYPQISRRTSQSPGNPLSPGPRPAGRPSPPNGYPSNGYPSNGYPPNGMPPNGRPSPPGVRQPVPRHPPGHGNAVAPQHVEQHAGVSNLNPPKSRPEVRSLTGSASASTGSTSLDSENSAHSSQISLGARPPLGVR